MATVERQTANEERLIASLEETAAEVCHRVDEALSQAGATGIPVAEGETKDEPSHTAVKAVLEFVAAKPEAALVLVRGALCAGAPARARRMEAIAAIAGAIERTWERERERPGPDLPAVAIVGGLLELLATRPSEEPGGLLGGAGGLDELESVTCAWIDSHWVEDPPFRWRQALAPERVRWIESVPVEAVPLEGPAAERILNATAQLVFQQGYPSVSVAKVCELAEVSGREFHSYFADVQAAAMAAAHLSFKVLMSSAVGTFFTPGEWPARICAAGGAMGEALHSHPALMHLMFVELHVISPDSFAKTRERLLAHTLMLEEGFTQSPSALALPRAAGELVGCALTELCHMQGTHFHEPQQPDLNPARTYLALAPFIGPSAAGDLATRV
jgi:AcrR family transcriptional regulator